MQKKLLSLLLLFCLAFCTLAGCSSSDPDKEQKDPNKTETAKKSEETSKPQATPIDINIGCMKGPTAIGMIKLLSDSDQGTAQNHYNYTIAGTADELSAGLVNGSLDIAAVPCNLASILYNKTNGEIITAAVNTLGVLYIVEAGETIQSVKDLAGKTIYSTGQGTTPEYTLCYLLTCAGLDPDKDVTIEYKSEAAEVVATLAQNPQAVAMLPQPYVTVAMTKNDKLRIALDITKEWEAQNDGTVVTGVIVARKSFIEEHKDAFANFLSEYEKSTAYANSSVEETAALLEKFDVFQAAIAKQAIPYCNVTYLDGQEMQKNVLAYLKVLYDQNPASIGGTLPEEGMFNLEGSGS